MGNFETIVVVMAALAVGGLCVLAFVGWWVNGTVQTGTDELREGSDELRTQVEKQGEVLASMTTALHQARMEVTRVHAQVGELRAELDLFVHGPPSLRAPGSGPGMKQTEKTP